jgi:uncharacterized membrane protein YgcG
VVDQSVYDEPGVLSPEVEAALERGIDAIEARSGAETVIYIQVDPSATGDSNLEAARALMDQWGIGREGFNDGFVILLSFQPDLQHGQLSTYAGEGFKVAYLSEDDQSRLRNDVIVPALLSQQVEAGMLLAVEFVDAAVTTEAANGLQTFRVINAAVGLIGGPVLFVLTLGLAFWTWRREGDDPELSDSESILMAGPPADMTPGLATVVRQGAANQHSLQTVLLDLASTGRLRFANLDQVGKVKSDDDPDPFIDPRIEVLEPSSDGRRLGRAEALAYAAIHNNSIGGILTRESLWSLNEELHPTLGQLEEEAVRIGWLTQVSTPVINRWGLIGVGEAILGGVSIFLAFVIPMSGLTLTGIGLLVGGGGTLVISRFMSKRTTKGAYVDSMLKAYRRTLAKTMAQARSMQQVVEDTTVKTLADTPDRAVVWGIALGLSGEVSNVLRRGLEDAQETGATAYYPIWLGSGGGWGTDATSASMVGAGGSLFSSGGIPDIGGMFSALGSVGSSPPSSSSSSGGGGGFGGGGGGGGGGGSSGF